MSPILTRSTRFKHLRWIRDRSCNVKTSCRSFSNICPNFQTTVQICGQLSKFRNNCQDFQTTARICKQLSGFSNSFPDFHQTAVRIFKQLSEFFLRFTMRYKSVCFHYLRKYSSIWQTVAVQKNYWAALRHTCWKTFSKPCWETLSIAWRDFSSRGLITWSIFCKTEPHQLIFTSCRRRVSKSFGRPSTKYASHA